MANCRSYNGNTAHTAKWEACPERTTFFLKILVIEKENNRFGLGGLRNSTCKLLAERFWDKYQIYHTNDQFKNHYKNKKNVWHPICWTRLSPGIGFNNDLKLFTASDKWWEENQVNL